MFDNEDETNIQARYSLTVKGNALPLQDWTDPWGSRRLRLLNFYTIGT
jgi:hypothetical protein